MDLRGHAAHDGVDVDQSPSPKRSSRATYSYYRDQKIEESQDFGLQSFMIGLLDRM